MTVRRAAVAWAATFIVACGLLALPLVAFAATSPVTIQNFAYAPSAVTIAVGDSVTWTNRDAASHSAKFSDRSTAVLSQGQSGTLQFTVAGTFPYVCGIHGASMQGTIIVRAAATVPPTAPPTAPPTPVRTAPPTIAPTEPPTAAPTEAATPSPSGVAAQLTPAPGAAGAGNAPLLIGAAALAVVALGAIAFFLAR